MKNPDTQDKISASLNFYLKRRKFSTDMTSESATKMRKLVCNKDEFLMNNLVASNTSTCNSVSLNCLSSDPSIIQSQFEKFESHITKNSDLKTSELESLLFPLLLHTFADLVRNGFKAAAIEMVKSKISLFPNKELSESLLSTNEKVITGIVTEIKNKKFKVSLSDEVFQRLLAFLKTQDNLCLLQIFNRHVDFTIIQDGRCTELPKNGSSDELKENSQQTNESDRSVVDALVKVSTRLKLSSHSLLPSIHQTNFDNMTGGLSCCSISTDEKFLSCGREDSDILICRLQPEHLSDGQCFKLKGHSHSVSGVDFLPDTRWLLSASYDKTVRLWDVKERKNVVTYKGHTYHVTAVCSAQSVGSMFASCSYDQTAKLWSTDRIFPLRSFLGHMQSVNCIAFHPNGNYLATGSSDSTVRLWNVQDGRSVRLLLGHCGRVDVVGFSSDGKYLVSAGEDTTVKVWDLSMGSVLKNLVGHTDHVYSVAFNKNSTALSSGAMDGNINVWSLHERDKSTSSSSQSPELVGTYGTKSDCVMFLKYGDMNLLHAVTKHL